MSQNGMTDARGRAGGEGSGAEAAWFRRWFGEEYLHLYPHRDLDEAEVAVRLLIEHGALPGGAPVLDLACGAGRHLQWLAEAGFDACGLDLSGTLLGRAREALGGRVPLVRADMRRLPFAPSSFVGVTSYFTSFGYFDAPGDDARVLAEVRRVLSAGGTFLIDFLNAEAVARTLTPRDEREVEGARVIQERRLVEGGRRVEKRIRIEPGDGAPMREFRERVRLYRVEELEALLAGAGIATVARFGSYAGEPLGASSPRVILLGRVREGTR